MKIGVIVANSNKDKNQLLFEAVCKASEPKGHTVINFGVFDNEEIFSKDSKRKQADTAFLKNCRYAYLRT